MTARKIFLLATKPTFLVCDQCGRSRQIEKDQIKSTNTLVKVRCKCGHTFNVMFEFRQQYRKTTCLFGRCHKIGQEHLSCEIVVVNVSKAGLGFNLEPECVEIQFPTMGDVLRVSFRLDNKTRTAISANVVIRYVKDLYYGVELLDPEEHVKKELGFYVMP